MRSMPRLTVAGRFNSELVLGALSLILWALTISVTIKYVSVIMRADNDGEGGILANVRSCPAPAHSRQPLGAYRGVAGARRHGLLLLRLSITPAVSVLSAVEGLEVLNPELKSAVVPVTVGVIAGPLRVSTPRHGDYRQSLRSRHGGVVRGDRGHRRRRDPARSGRARRDQSTLRAGAARCTGRASHSRSSARCSWP